MRLLLMLCCVCLPLLRAAVVVSVQSQSQEAMAALTASIDQAAEYTPNRMVLGAIEATMSRVVDSDSLFPEESIKTTPLMARLTDMSYDAATNTWVVEYESMRNDPGAIANTFDRILYFSRKDVVLATGDSRNPLLRQELSSEQQMATLATDYVVSGAVGFGADYIEYAGNITTTRVDAPNSLRHSISIRIPHEYLIANLASKSLQYYNDEYGNVTTWTFGIGMAFTNGNDLNMVMFDRFHLYEKNVAFFAVQAETKYSLAKHVEFYALDVGDSIKIAVFYFTLDEHKLLGGDVFTSINGAALQSGTCAAMQALVDALPVPSCLLSFALCVPQTTMVNGVQAVALAVPVPLVGTISANILLNITDTVAQQQLITSLNFKLSSSSSVCLANVVVLHDPMMWVQVDMHTTSAAGGMGPARTLAGTGAYGTLLTDNQDVNTAEVMSQALLTLVVRPKDTAAAQNYFAGTTQLLQLDDVLMSHAYGEDPGLPEAPSRVAPDESNDYRSRIEFNGQNTCPMQTTQSSAMLKCVSTRDWDWTGVALRPQASGSNYFVHEVLADNEAASRLFLGRVFGADGVSELTGNAVESYLLASTLLRQQEHARVYWIWPVYNWPHSPIGLVDKTLISFSWSITGRERRRRLLGTWRRETLAVPGALAMHKVPPRLLFRQNAGTTRRAGLPPGLPHLARRADLPPHPAHANTTALNQPRWAPR